MGFEEKIDTYTKVHLLKNADTRPKTQSIKKNIEMKKNIKKRNKQYEEALTKEQIMQKKHTHANKGMEYEDEHTDINKGTEKGEEYRHINKDIELEE